MVKVMDKHLHVYVDIEKLSAFEKRRKKHQKSKVSKKDIDKYVNNQDDEFVNNPLQKLYQNSKIK